MPDILFVDDDLYSMLTYVDVLQDAGFHVQQASGADDALRQVTSREFTAAVLDVRMPRESLGERETAGGHRTGVALARRMRGERPGLPIVLLTSSDDAMIYDWANRDSAVVCLDKRRTRPDQLVRHVRRAVREPGASPNVFLVHGRDHKAMFAVKDYVQNNLRFNEPTVLCHKPNDGRTIIEKLEHYADDADVVIVLLTPDDLGRTANGGSVERTRGRQNVIFELGYVFGAVRRSKVLVLTAGVAEMPQEIAGVVYIDISHGIHAAGEDIRRELAQWL